MLEYGELQLMLLLPILVASTPSGASVSKSRLVMFERLKTFFDLSFLDISKLSLTCPS